MSRATVVLTASLAFIFLAGAGVQWWRWSSSRAEDGHSRPLMSANDLSLPTYKRSCRHPADCELPLACVPDPRVNDWRCLGSECRTDFQCQPGLVCRDVVSIEKTTRVRLCAVEGLRLEGEPCTQLPRKQDEGCARGLLCNYRHCGRPCQPGDASSCPRGSTCWDGLLGASCLPSCLETGCPLGKRCYRISKQFSVCDAPAPRGFDCEKESCPAGEECASNVVEGTEHIFMWCHRPCGEGQPACAAGSVCRDGSCDKLCRLDSPDDCGPRQQCVFSPYDALWVCSPR